MVNRIALFQEMIKQTSAEAAIVESEINRRYLTGVQTSAGCLLVTGTEAIFLTDGRYIEKAQSQSRDCEVYLSRDFDLDMGNYLDDHHIKTVMAERDRMPVRRYGQLKERFKGTVISDEWNADDFLFELRKKKDAYELACFREAQKIADQAFEHILKFIRPGRKESEIKMELGTTMVKLGSQNYGMDFIVSSGEKTSLPHGGSGDRTVQAGDFVMMDFGATIDGYASDMTRTVGVERLTDEQRDVYQLVLHAQKLVLKSIKPGLTGQETDRIAREFIHSHGQEGRFDHGLGHSLGLEIHEQPRCRSDCKEILRSGEMMTVEPGIYLPGRFGVRIEDMGVLTGDGFENMTGSVSELLILRN